MAFTLGLAACTEDYKGGAACPELCPTQPTAFRDTTIDVVELDTTIAGFPTLGLAQSLLLASRKDTVESSIVLRFDVLPTAFTPNNGAVDTVTITKIDSVFLRVVIDSTGARGLTQVELQAYDVDTTELSPSSATIRSLFRPDRLIGSVPITTVAARDTVRIPLLKAVLEKKIADRARVRIGILLVGASSSQVRVLAFSANGIASPLLAFDPTTDTTYSPVAIAPNTTAGGTTAEELLAAAVASVAIKGTPDAGAQILSVGGFPSRRTYLRFNIPALILDSSSVVRAELLLTQVRSAGVDLNDTISVVPLIGATTSQLTDIRRSMDLAVEGLFAFPRVLALRVIPADSGVRRLNVLGALNNWSSLPAGTPKSLILRTANEGSEPGEFRFYSIEAPLSVRPRLRITFLPRVDRALP
ncbi:MAG: hypothetical protein H7Z40_04285 [Phycisphaerae bacterium]|nr:hypothetical protein [Gemmatimonadaceae bacterium]